MRPEVIAAAALAVSLIGHIIHALVLAMHCRRDKREIRRLETGR